MARSTPTIAKGNSGPVAGNGRQDDRIDGLWGIVFGNGFAGQPVNTLFFTAGTDDEATAFMVVSTCPTPTTDDQQPQTGLAPPASRHSESGQRFFNTHSPPVPDAMPSLFSCPLGPLRAALIGTVLLTCGERADAVPSFARQTGFECTNCHLSWPELTSVGRQFKLGGYTLMREPKGERPWVVAQR